MPKKMYYINSDGYLIKPQGMFKNTPRRTQKLLGWKRIWIDERKINPVEVQRIPLEENVMY